jgi:recombination protein RecT
MVATDTKAIVKAPQDNLAEYFHRPDIIEKFHAVLGNEANAYVQSVLIACTANADLMRCEPQSILRSSLRAASLELSCDPALKQAYLVPINGKAEFWPHYRGLYTLMVRTGKYYAINVTPVREGQRVMQHSTTGIHYLMLENGLLVENDKLSKLFSQGYQDVTDGHGDKKIIGYLGYFETNKGFKKTVYMSMADISEHAEMYSPGYHNPKSPWNNPKMRPAMELKSAFRELIKWGDMSGKDSATVALRTAMNEDDSEKEREWANEDEIKDAVVYDATPEPEAPRTEEQNLHDLGYDTPESQVSGPAKVAWTMAQRDALILEKLAKDDFGARGMLGLSNLPVDATPELIVAWGKTYRRVRPLEVTKGAPNSKTASDAANEWYDEYKNTI